MSLTMTDIPGRLAEKIDVHGGYPKDPHTAVDGECWTFDSWHNSAGYPYMSWEGKDQPAHRLVFMFTTGQDLAELDLDHLCRNVACVNPGHHEAVTHAENMLRIRKHQVACRKFGHDWTNPYNVRTRPNGARYCAECDRMAQRSKFQRKRMASILGGVA